MGRAGPHFIRVQHGKMVLNIPLSLFEEGTSIVRPVKAQELRFKLRSQYPWLTDNAVDVILRSSSEEMSRLIEERKPAAQKAKEMLRSGRTQAAFDWLSVYLDQEPEDADAWYALGEVLFKLDRGEEGFEAMRKGRAIAAAKKRSRSPPL